MATPRVSADRWAHCQCGQNNVNMWAGEGLCSPCTEGKIGAIEFERRYQATRASDGSWAGPEASLKAILNGASR